MQLLCRGNAKTTSSSFLIGTSRCFPLARRILLSSNQACAEPSACCRGYVALSLSQEIASLRADKERDAREAGELVQVSSVVQRGFWARNPGRHRNIGTPCRSARRHVGATRVLPPSVKYFTKGSEGKSSWCRFGPDPDKQAPLLCFCGRKGCRRALQEGSPVYD